jgi:hypothetical protein
MTVILRWHLSRKIGLRWRGQGFKPPVTAEQATALAAVIGPSGGAASISAAPDNQLTIDQAGGLYVGPPQLKSVQW